MKTSTDYNIAQGLSILLVGDPKSGKTCVAAAFPAPYFLDVDGNLDSAIRILAGKQFWYDQPVKESKEEWDVWPKAIECLKAAVAHPDIKTIIVDSFSLLTSFTRAALLHNLQRINAVDRNGKPLDNLRINDYLTLLDWFRKFVFGLRQCGKYIIFTSHQQVSKDELTGANHYALAVPGQSKDSFGGCFSDVWATTSTPLQGGKTKYEIRTRPTGFHVALGTSIRSLPPAIDITDKTPDQIWSILAPQLSAVQVLKPTAPTLGTSVVPSTKPTST